MNKQPIVILYSNEYSMLDEVTKQVNEGVSIQYAMSDTLQPYVGSDKARGYRVVKGSVPIICRNEIKSVPGVYNATLDIKLNDKGQPLLKLIDVEFVSPLLPEGIKK